MGLGFVERIRAASAAERWVAHVRFPAVSLEAANGARKMLVMTFVRGWTDQVLSPFNEAKPEGPRSEKEAFEAFSKEFLEALHPETAGMTTLAQTMRGLEVAFRSGWGASKRRSLGLKA